MDKNLDDIFNFANVENEEENFKKILERELTDFLNSLGYHSLKYEEEIISDKTTIKIIVIKGKDKMFSRAKKVIFYTRRWPIPWLKPGAFTGQLK